MKEEDWINDVMAGLDDLPKAEMRTDFMANLEQRIHSVSVFQPKVKPIVAWLAAASIAVLFAANIVLVNDTSTSSKETPYQEVLENYGFITTDNPYSLNYDE